METSSAVQPCQNELVDGSTLLKLTAQDFKDLKIKTGPLQKLLTLIKNVSTPKQTNEVFDCDVLPDGQILVKKQSVASELTQNTVQSVVVYHNSSNAQLNRTEKVQADLVLLQSPYNVREWVKKYDKKVKPERKLEAALDSGIVSEIQRQALVRVVVGNVAEITGNLYPSPEVKESAAKSIVLSFEKIKSPIGNGYEHYYDRKSGKGFIEDRLKNMRKSLPLSEKKRKVQDKKADTGKPLLKINLNDIENLELLSTEEYESKVSELQFKLPNLINKQRILQLMDETRANRQKWIHTVDKDGQVVTLHKVLETFPKFVDFNGELILREFQALITDKDQFLALFPSFYAPRILRYCLRTKPTMFEQLKDIKDANLKALLLLPVLLPSPNYAKKTNNPKKIKSTIKNQKVENSPLKLPNQNLMRFIDEKDDLFRATTTKITGPIQPYLICAMNGVVRSGTFFIMADNNLINVGINVITAFDILLKLYYCFDLNFPPDLEIFYNFVTTCVMDLEGMTQKNCCIALNSTLLNMNDDDEEEQDEVENELAEEQEQSE